MKITFCDICLAKEGKYVVASCRFGFKGPYKVDACKKHDKWGKGLSKDEFERKALEMQMAGFNAKAKDFPYTPVHEEVVAETESTLDTTPETVAAKQ